MTTRTKIVFFIITGIAVFLVAGVFMAENLLGYTLPTRGGVQVDIQVAVAPSLEGWVSDAATDFNNRNAQITVDVVALRGLDANRDLAVTAGTPLPDAWIAETDFVRDMARSIPYETTGQSVAQTQLTWVARSDLSGLQGQLDWPIVQNAAVDAAAWQSAGGDRQFDAAIPSPGNTVEGLAAFISAAANYHGQTNLAGASVTDQAFLDQVADVMDVVPTKTRSPLDQFSTPPVSVDVGILLESDLKNLDASLIRQTPQYNVIFNYPYLIRNDDILDDASDRQQAATRFRDFLLDAERQAQLANYGFMPPDEASMAGAVQIDGNTASTLWNRLR